MLRLAPTGPTTLSATARTYKTDYTNRTARFLNTGYTPASARSPPTDYTYCSTRTILLDYPTVYGSLLGYGLHRMDDSHSTDGLHFPSGSLLAHGLHNTSSSHSSPGLFAVYGSLAIYGLHFRPRLAHISWVTLSRRLRSLGSLLALLLRKLAKLFELKRRVFLGALLKGAKVLPPMRGLLKASPKKRSVPDRTRIRNTTGSHPLAVNR